MAKTYELVKGDTMGAIAQRFGMTLAELLKLNPQINTKDPKWDRKMKIGQSIIIEKGPPPKESGGPIKGKGGIGESYGDKGGFTPKVRNPTSRYPRVASAVKKEDKWRAGEELTDKKKVEIPIEIKTPEPPAPPPAPPTPFSETVFGRIHQAIDPVRALSGNDNPGFNDYLSTALMGLGGTPVRPSALPNQPLPTRVPFGDNPIPKVSEAPLVRDVPAPGIAHLPRQLRGTNQSPWLDPWQNQVTHEVTKRDQLGRPLATRSTLHNDPVYADDVDPYAGMSNVRSVYPYEPELPPPGPAGKAPLGAKERSVEINAPKPLRVDASTLKSVDDYRNALRSASDNTVVFDNASSLGFNSDRVVVSGRRWGGKADPDAILDAHQTPFLSPQDFLRAVTRGRQYRGI